jgi:hypothetical protein
VKEERIICSSYAAQLLLNGGILKLNFLFHSFATVREGSVRKRKQEQSKAVDGK